MFGSHLSIAGTMSAALLEAESLGLDCVQVFTKNQQQWKAPPLKAEMVDDWKQHLRRLKWQGEAAATNLVVSHASYLINLASPDAGLRAKSLELMREEYARCVTLGIGQLVFHPGAFTTSSLAEGMERISAAVAQVLSAWPDAQTVMCFENVAGAGSTIGRKFEELAEIRKRAIDHGAPAEQVGFCIDTCHAHAAGYDLAAPGGAERTAEELERTVGLSTVRVLHLNDSKGAAGSRLDRHEHIGRGTIGAAGFAGFLACRAFAGIPKVMETPKGEDASGVPWDSVNVALLRRLAKGDVPTDLGGVLVVATAKAVAGAKPTKAGKSAVKTTQPRKPKAKAGKGKAAAKVVAAAKKSKTKKKARK